MRIELIKEAIIGVLKKTLPVEYAHYFLTHDELMQMEEYVKAMHDRALKKANEQKPWPGEAARDVEAPKKAYMPNDGLRPHPYEVQNNLPIVAYKHILRHFSEEGVSPHGHVDFTPKTGEIHVHSALGRQMISQAAKGKISPEFSDQPKAEAPAAAPAPKVEAPAAPAASATESAAGNVPTIPVFGKKP